MKEVIKLSTFRYLDPPKRGQGLRIGTTRRPPRGVPKSKWVKAGYFDVWLPSVAPSASLLRWMNHRTLADPATRGAFFARYQRELSASAEARQTIKFLAEIASRMPISIGCFCDNEALCHRSHLARIIRANAPRSQSRISAN